jgi:hypothetical protein
LSLERSRRAFLFALPARAAALKNNGGSMLKVEHSLALSSRGRLILRTSMEEHLTSLLKELLSTTTILKPGIYSVNLEKAWVSIGAERMETTVTLSFRVHERPSPAKQAAVAAAFS